MSQPASGETDVKPKTSGLSCLYSAYDTTIEKFTSSMRFSSFKKKYRAIYEVDPDGLKIYFDQLKKQLSENIREDVEFVTTDHGIGKYLELLEKINENKGAISWRPSGNPEEDLRDHLYACKVQHRNKLQSYLSKLQVDNEEITTEAAINHAEILHLKETNKELYEKLSSITDSYTGNNCQNFQAKAAECFNKLKLERDRGKAAKYKNTESPNSTKKPRVL